MNQSATGAAVFPLRAAKNQNLPGKVCSKHVCSCHVETYQMLLSDVISPYPEAWYTPGVVSSSKISDRILHPDKHLPHTPEFSTTRRASAVTVFPSDFKFFGPGTDAVSGTPPNTPSTTGIWPAYTPRMEAAARTPKKAGNKNMSIITLQGGTFLRRQ